MYLYTDVIGAPTYLFNKLLYYFNHPKAILLFTTKN